MKTILIHCLYWYLASQWPGPHQYLRNCLSPCSSYDTLVALTGPRLRNLIQLHFSHDPCCCEFKRGFLSICHFALQTLIVSVSLLGSFFRVTLLKYFHQDWHCRLFYHPFLLSDDFWWSLYFSDELFGGSSLENWHLQDWCHWVSLESSIFEFFCLHADYVPWDGWTLLMHYYWRLQCLVKKHR